MFWWLELPVTITFFVLTGLVVIVAVVSPSLKWSRAKALGRAIIFAFFGFVPTCYGVMKVVDARRFGLVQYSSFDDIGDEKIRRHLPPAARDITVDQSVAQNRARYTISEAELRKHLDAEWQHREDLASNKRTETRTGSSTLAARLFSDLSWPALHDPIQLDGPRMSNWAGAVYFFDPETNTVYQETAYW